MNNYLGGVLYVLFFIVLVKIIWIKGNSLFIMLLVISATFGLETLQLWQPPFLTSVRSNFLGSALFGTDFDWLDFPHYILGGIIGIYLLKKCRVQ